MRVQGRTRLIAVAGIGAVFAAAAVFLGLRALQPAQVALLQPDDPAVVALGEQVYSANCAICHGARLEGQTDWQRPGPDGRLRAPPHDASGHTWHHPDALLFRITRFGTAKAIGQDDYQSDMPAFETILSDREIVAALSFIKAQWPREVQQRHDRLNAHYADRSSR